MSAETKDKIKASVGVLLSCRMFGEQTKAYHAGKQAAEEATKLASPKPIISKEVQRRLKQQQNLAAKHRSESK